MNKKIQPIHVIGILLIVFQFLVFIAWIFDYGRIAFLQWYHIFFPTFFFVGYTIFMLIAEIIWWRKQSDELPRF